jgi:hypothetical protein
VSHIEINDPRMAKRLEDQVKKSLLAMSDRIEILGPGEVEKRLEMERLVREGKEMLQLLRHIDCKIVLEGPHVFDLNAIIDYRD